MLFYYTHHANPVLPFLFHSFHLYTSCVKRIDLEIIFNFPKYLVSAVLNHHNVIDFSVCFGIPRQITIPGEATPHGTHNTCNYI